MNSLLSRVVLPLVLLAGPALAQHGVSAHDDVALTVTGDSAERTVLAFDIRSFDRQTIRIDGADYEVVGLENAGIARMDEAGHPAVPALCSSVLVPDTARMEARIVDADYYEIENFRLAPHRGVITRDVDPDTVPYVFGPTYAEDAMFPPSIVSLRDPYILHDVRGLVVEVFPLQYNPVTATLRVHTRIEVEVRAVGVGRINVIDRLRSPQRSSYSFERLYRNQFCNYIGARSTSTLAATASEDGDLLILSHGAFMSAMQPLADWKDSIGIDTTIVNVATIGNNATSIKNYINGVYYSSNLSYVLLVGDSAQVATSNHGGAESDPTYATITADWYPDVFVGRFSAQNVSQVDTQVQRTVEYEQAGHSLSMGGWNAKAMGIASNEGAGAGHYGESDKQHQNLIRSELLAVGFSSVDQIYDPGASASAVRNGLNDGRRCVNYIGHGYTYGWGTTGFSTSNINSLTNVGKLPFVHSVACLGGDFSNTTSFGEVWLRATHNDEPTGAIAAYCSSVNQSWAPPMYAQGNHAYGDRYGAAERFWDEINWSVGGCWYGGSCTMMDLAGGAGRDMFMTWHLFGDPSVRIMEDPPLAISLTEDVPNWLSTGAAAEFTLEILDGAQGYVADSGRVHYRLDGGSYVEAPITALGGDLYGAILPHTAPGDEPEFYFSAEGDGGFMATLPGDAPSSVFSFDVCLPEIALEDDFETDQGWAVENIYLAYGAWERCVPNPTSGGQYGPTTDNPAGAGTYCYVTGNGPDGGHYTNYDIDGGPTRLISPTIDLSGENAEISAYNWYYSELGDDPYEIDVSNNNGSTWTNVYSSNASLSGWSPISFVVGDYVTPTSQVKVRFSAQDQPSNDIVEAGVDDFMVLRYNFDPSFWAEEYEISVTTGGAAPLLLDASVGRAGKPYLILGSLSGTSPGFDIGGIHVPLNWDDFTNMTIAMSGTPNFMDFFGILDGSGQATATFDTVNPIDVSFVGTEASFVYGTLSPLDFVSNPVTVTFVL